MAIEIKEFRLPTTPEQVRSTLQYATDNFGIYIDLDRTYEMISILYENKMQCARVLREFVGPNVDLNKKQNIINVFIDNMVDPDLFGPKRNLLNAQITKSILDSKQYSEGVKEFAKYYTILNSLKQRQSTLTGYTKLPKSDKWSKKGHRLVVAKPKWDIANTSRMLASEPGIQQIAKDYSDLITEPEGYNLVRCDSNQIEPRITYSYFVRDDLIMNCIKAYGDAYFGMLAYCLMDEFTESNARRDFSTYKLIEKSEDFTNKRKQFKVLALAANYGSHNLANVSSSLAAAYDQKIVNHPKRKEWEQRVREQCERGDMVFYGAFGTPVVPGPTEKYVPGSSGWNNHVIRCGINNPVQTTASELMMFSVYEADKILSKAKDSHIAYYKHDEGAFYVSDADKEAGILDALSDITAYNVENWIPIPCEAEYGTIASSYPTVL